VLRKPFKIDALMAVLETTAQRTTMTSEGAS
jgi:hypothetical protein